MKGFTLLSLLVAITVAGILWMIGPPLFNSQPIDCKNTARSIGYINRAKLASMTATLGAVHIDLERYYLQHNAYPASMDLGLDPWDRPFVYSQPATTGKARKDHQNHDVNTGGYPDVYSLGPDGKTASPFTSTVGCDDFVIAKNGAYIGVAAFYYRKK